MYYSFGSSDSTPSRSSSCPIRYRHSIGPTDNWSGKSEIRYHTPTIIRRTDPKATNNTPSLAYNPRSVSAAIIQRPSIPSNVLQAPSVSSYNYAQHLASRHNSQSTLYGDPYRHFEANRSTPIVTQSYSYSPQIISYPNDPYETILETVEETTTTVHYAPTSSRSSSVTRSTVPPLCPSPRITRQIRHSSPTVVHINHSSGGNPSYVTNNTSSPVVRYTSPVRVQHASPTITRYTPSPTSTRHPSPAVAHHFEDYTPTSSGQVTPRSYVRTQRYYSDQRPSNWGPVYTVYESESRTPTEYPLQQQTPQEGKSQNFGSYEPKIERRLTDASTNTLPPEPEKPIIQPTPVPTPITKPSPRPIQTPGTPSSLYELSLSLKSSKQPHDIRNYVEKSTMKVAKLLENKGVDTDQALRAAADIVVYSAHLEEDRSPKALKLIIERLLEALTENQIHERKNSNSLVEKVVETLEEKGHHRVYEKIERNHNSSHPTRTNTARGKSNSHTSMTQAKGPQPLHNIPSIFHHNNNVSDPVVRRVEAALKVIDLVGTNNENANSLRPQPIMTEDNRTYHSRSPSPVITTKALVSTSKTHHSNPTPSINISQPVHTPLISNFYSRVPVGPSHYPVSNNTLGWEAGEDGEVIRTVDFVSSDSRRTSTSDFNKLNVSPVKEVLLWQVEPPPRSQESDSSEPTPQEYYIPMPHKKANNKDPLMISRAIASQRNKSPEKRSNPTHTPQPNRLNVPHKESHEESFFVLSPSASSISQGNSSKDDDGQSSWILDVPKGPAPRYRPSSSPPEPNLSPKDNNNKHKRSKSASSGSNIKYRESNNGNNSNNNSHLRSMSSGSGLRRVRKFDA